ncbi:bifunctional metallophosphatase/5'-nucleotidase [Aliishimia ponticola]|nr:5'-nucleotidase C-terminal domain-containing protein [Aliishimia ponticola]
MTNDTVEIERVRILATSDVHMHLLCHDYATGETVDSGLERLEPLIAQLRKESAEETPPRHVILVDNGDMLQGTALGDYIANHHDRQRTHPVADLMNGLAYDVMGLGNHDLDYGLPYLQWFARSLKAPIVSSNLATSPQSDWIKPHAIFTVGALKIGFLSVLPPRAVKGLFARLGSAVTMREMRSAMRVGAQGLREQGADLVVGLAHTGFGDADRDNILEEIAQDGMIDLLVGGHSHHSFPQDVTADSDGVVPAKGHLSNIPCVMPKHEAGGLGRVDLDLKRNGRGTWHVDRSDVLLIEPAPSEQPAPLTRSALACAHDATCAHLDQPIGTTDRPLHSFFARIQPTAIQALIAAAQARAIADITRGTRFSALPVLSAVASPRAGGRGGPRNYIDIPKGPIRTRHITELNAYPNYLWAVDMTGAGLRRWLTHGARSLMQLGPPGTGLVNPAIPSFDFDTIYGITYTVDLCAPPGSDNRITDLCCDGRPVADTDRFIVAVNSFRACGGGGFPGMGSDRAIFRPELTSNDVLQSYVQSGAPPWNETPWRFKDCGGIQSWFLTGPGALSHLRDIDHLSPGTPEPTPNGFLRIPVTL